VNETAINEQWPARLEFHGLVWHDPDTAAITRDAALARFDHTIRWLLRRFVDPEWIDERLCSPVGYDDEATLPAHSV
jgi:hypothetical protein